MATNTPKDPTFRSYSAEEARIYATHRLSYPEALYNKVLEHHASTGGQFGLLFDVGCGPGNATRDVALSFDQALGADPGDAMIGAARDIGGKTKSGKEIRYEVCAAEEISRIEGLEEESVDLLTSAMAAHWFDMPKFWADAAKVVKPGGTVALWTCSSLFPRTSKSLARNMHCQSDNIWILGLQTTKKSRKCSFGSKERHLVHMHNLATFCL